MFLKQDMPILIEVQNVVMLMQPGTTMENVRRTSSRLRHRKLWYFININAWYLHLFFLYLNFKRLFFISVTYSSKRLFKLANTSLGREAIMFKDKSLN